MDDSAGGQQATIEDEREHFTIIPEWVLDAEISDRAVRLYGVIGRYGNGSGQRTVSRRVLAERCRCSVDSIDRATTELEDVGAVRVERRSEIVEGRKTNHPNRYILTARPSRTAAATPPQERGHPSRSPAATPSRTAAAQPKGVSTDRDLPTEEQAPLPPGSSLAIAAPPLFDEFWMNYPRKVGKPAAATSFKRAIQRAPFAEVMAGLAAWVDYWRNDDVEQRLIPHPTTWLNQHRWNDEPPPPRRAARSRRDEQMDSIGDLVASLPQELFDPEPLRAIGAGS